jgi:hypothetical protein
MMFFDNMVFFATKKPYLRKRGEAIRQKVLAQARAYWLPYPWLLGLFWSFPLSLGTYTMDTGIPNRYCGCWRDLDKIKVLKAVF